jgi:hypothetical protein
LFYEEIEGFGLVMLFRKRGGIEVRKRTKRSYAFKI